MDKVIMHVIYPGMTRSRPVIVSGPVTETGYTGYVWTRNVGVSDMIPMNKTHCSRLSDQPIGH